MKKLTFLLLAVFMISCGTQKSLSVSEYITYGVITVSTDLTVTGKLVYENDSIVEISIDGALKSYNKSKIINFQKITKPDPDSMLKDIVKNTSKTTSNTGFFVTLSVIAIAAIIVLSIFPQQL